MAATFPTRSLTLEQGPQFSEFPAVSHAQLNESTTEALPTRTYPRVGPKNLGSLETGRSLKASFLVRGAPPPEQETTLASMRAKIPQLLYAERAMKGPTFSEFR